MIREQEKKTTEFLQRLLVLKVTETKSESEKSSNDMSPQRQKRILILKELEGQQISYARMLGLDPIIEPALKFEFPEYWDHVLKVINENPKAGWIVTSRNAVKALQRLRDAGLGVMGDQKIYAVGPKTKQALEDIGLHADIPLNANAEGLAEHIIEEGEINTAIYFCGNRSRQVLQNKLEEEGIEVQSIEVYETHLRDVDPPERAIDGILFYSPSGVQAYEESVGFDGEEEAPQLFSIGPTTADRLRESVDREIHIADRPGTEPLLRKVADVLESRM